MGFGALLQGLEPIKEKAGTWVYRLPYLENCSESFPHWSCPVQEGGLRDEK